MNIQTNEDQLDPPKTGFAVIAYVVTLLAAIAAIKQWELRGAALAVAIAIPAAALLWMAIACRSARRFRGPASAAQRAYMKRFIPLMIGYVALLFGAVWLDRHFHPVGPLAIVLAVLPALPLIGVVWSMGRLIVDERDEYQRSLTIRQFLVATGFMLAVTSVWGFLEGSGEVPHLPMYWAFILWCGGLGLGSLFNELKR